jgi:hypothetical protein
LKFLVSKEVYHVKKYDLLLISMGTTASLMLSSGVASLIGDSKARLCVWLGIIFGITVFECLLLSILKELQEINTKLNKGDPPKPPQDDEYNNK